MQVGPVALVEEMKAVEREWEEISLDKVADD